MKPLNFDKAVAQHFDRAATSYAQHDEIQRKAAHDLLDCANTVKPISQKTIVDIGCGPAVETARLESYSQQYLGIDISREMLARAQTLNPHLSWLQGHWTALPLANESVDWVFANLSLQWVDDLNTAFAEVYRVLKPGGIATVNTLLPGTFSSLQSSWAEVDNKPHINNFSTQADIAQATEAFPWLHKTFYTHNYVQYFPSLRALLTSIKGVGASLVKRDNNSGLMTKSKFQTLETAYETYRTSDGLPLEWHIINIVLIKHG
ncbi:methyltransferase domain-containing protein [Idiomarina piscisalsi]|uniref:Biotin synthase n=1 Tax=Idiomarina piscisalsi TaxID=1096243 RepID=A0A432YWJ7_9GAMM|nr:methyltransferase domain-containing protein [Idiomarina piscisalsi]RUO67672.1 biotin synthase [Idiomarina piscisalsi]